MLCLLAQQKVYSFPRGNFSQAKQSGSDANVQGMHPVTHRLLASLPCP